MTNEILSPVFPESVVTGSVSKWYKKTGDSIKRDDLLVEIETDKIVLEVLAISDGILKSVLKNEGEKISSREVLGLISRHDPIVSPSARRIAEGHNLCTSNMSGTGKDGRITKEDVLVFLSNEKKTISLDKHEVVIIKDERTSVRKPMSPWRKTIAKRLAQAQSNMVMLTTFNEADMTEIIGIRKEYKELFAKTYKSTNLGMVSFFVKAAVHALKEFPTINSSIDGDEIVHYNYIDIGIAVSTPQGLIVPVLRNTNLMSISDIENQIYIYKAKALNSRLSMDEIKGGTFTITNGGIFGSVSSTPIINPPQVAILGMHSIIKRPIVLNNKIEIRPMMNLALSYDHCLIDGQEAVSFLLKIKKLVEKPVRLLLGI